MLGVKGDWISPVTVSVSRVERSGLRGHPVSRDPLIRFLNEANRRESGNDKEDSRLAVKYYTR